MSTFSTGLAGHIDAAAPATTWKDRIVPALLSAVAGLMLVYAMGFSHSVELHNAAHDGRHSAGFPCH